MIPRQSESSVSWTGVDRWTVGALVLPLAALAPLLYMQANLLFQKPHLQFFPLALVGAAYFLRWDAEPMVCHARRGWVVPLWIGALLLSFVALWLGSPWMAQLCFIVHVVVWALGARPHFSFLRILGIGGLLAVALPPPFGWDHQLVQALQAISSLVCSRLMDLSSIVHVRRGNIIEIVSKPLFIEEACSGVDSQYALMAVAGVLLLLGRAGLWVSLITIVTVPIWAILGNLLRIYLIVIGLDWFEVDLSSGTVHTLLGLGIFAFTAWVHWSSVQLLNYLQLAYFDRQQSSISTSVAMDGSSVCEVPMDGVEGLGQPTRRVSIQAAWMAIPLLLLVFFPASVQAVLDFHAAPDLPSISAEVAERFPGRNDLRVTGGARMLGYQSQLRERDDMLGQHSRVWQIGNGFSRITVCLDFPFRGWHPLWECYMNSGWKRQSTQVVGVAGESLGAGPFPYYESILENDLGDIAVLHFSLFDEDGKPYQFEGSFEFRKHANRLSNNIWTRSRRTERVLEPITFQFQQLSQTNVSPSESQLIELRQLYEQSRRQVYEHCMPILDGLGAADGVVDGGAERSAQ
jgi:exosortase